MDSETTTNPVEVEIGAAATSDPAQEVDPIELQLEEGGEPIAALEEEEVEYDGLKLKVPKDQAQKVRDALLRQADYTR